MAAMVAASLMDPASPAAMVAATMAAGHPAVDVAAMA